MESNHGNLVACWLSLATLAGLPAWCSYADAAAPESTGWDAVPAILEQIRPPTFPDRDFEITAYGAVGDGAADCKSAFDRAIAACARAGGG
jgi:hypothetical protein